LDFKAVVNTPVEALFGFWEQITKNVIADESLSGILFDTYPLHEEEIHQNHFPFFKEAYRMLKPGGVLTYYSDEIKDFSRAHLRALNDAGFIHIDKKICIVSPPKDCAYWQSNTIVAPIITK
jgi:guanidinoacetate N-methyltransferase